MLFFLFLIIIFRYIIWYIYIYIYFFVSRGFFFFFRVSFLPGSGSFNVFIFVPTYQKVSVFWEKKHGAEILERVPWTIYNSSIVVNPPWSFHPTNSVFYYPPFFNRGSSRSSPIRYEVVFYTVPTPKPGDRFVKSPVLPAVAACMTAI